MPSDQQHVKPPKTDITSDKNRVAQSRTPTPDRETLRKLRNAQQAGRPAPQPPAPAPAPAQQAMQQQSAQPASPQQQTGAESAAQQQNSQTAQLQTPQQPKNPGPSPFKTGGAPGIQQAIESIASNHGTTHMSFGGGDYGATRIRPNTPLQGDVEILTDTLGVDFGPYLQRVLYAIKSNWENAIPEGARMRKGKLSIQFAILKDGRVAAMQRVATSGDITMDRAAWAGITASDPFDALPSQFRGQYLELRINFLYNIDPNTDALK
jgi:TonB C terminal